jgi:hypothetical protein
MDNDLCNKIVKYYRVHDKWLMIKCNLTNFEILNYDHHKTQDKLRHTVRYDHVISILRLLSYLLDSI